MDSVLGRPERKSHVLLDQSKMHRDVLRGHRSTPLLNDL